VYRQPVGLKSTLLQCRGFRVTCLQGGGLRSVEYTPDWFEKLRQATDGSPHQHGLKHRPFVDYYFTTGSAKLLLAVDQQDAITGLLGGEMMPLELNGRTMTFFYGRDFLALRPGSAVYLFKKWLAYSEGRGFAIGGTEDFQKVVRALGWESFGVVRPLYLNQPYSRWDGENRLRLAAKSVIDWFKRRPVGRFQSRIPAEAVGNLSLREESVFTQDMLPTQSPFTLRFAPTVEHLNWRYNTRLSFVRYRVFRLLFGGDSVGYVIINERPDRLLVAHCDGQEPGMLAYGALLSLLEAGRHDRRPRTLMLATTHSVMKPIFEQFGFREGGINRKLNFGGVRKDIEVPSDIGQWLVNWDWGGRALRSPFLDEAPETHNESHPHRSSPND